MAGGAMQCLFLGVMLAGCVGAAPGVIRPQTQSQPVLDDTQILPEDEMHNYLLALKGLLGDMDDEQELNYPSDNTDSYHVEEDDMDSKRFDADAFLPSRGKKWSSSSRTDYGDSQRKRYNLPGGFIATRGKKDQDSWLNARGRRLSAGQFHGVRGKRTWASEEIEDSAALGDQLQMLINYLRELKSDRYAGDDGLLEVKRQPPAGFHGVRGKRDLRQ